MLKLPKQVCAALALLENAGHEAFVVGGCVRDMLMGREPTDYDVATSATPEQVRAAFKGYDVIDTGLKHGTVTVVMGGDITEMGAENGAASTASTTLGGDIADACAGNGAASATLDDNNIDKGAKLGTSANFVSGKNIDESAKLGTTAAPAIVAGGGAQLARMPIEITTYRQDGQYTDGRRPESVSFTKNLQQDLARRDFTINAIAYNPRTGIVDPFDGAKHIAQGRLACVGAADARLREDALRILRALRFISTLGFEADEELQQSLHKNAALLKKISAERIFAELLKILCGARAEHVLRSYMQIFYVFIPELITIEGYDQHTPHHEFDVLEHTLRAVGLAPQKQHLRLALLLHDTGKPQAVEFKEDGRAHYNGHARISADIARTVLNRLRCPNALKNRVIALINCHSINFVATQKSVQKGLTRLGPSLFFDLLDFKQADDMAKKADPPRRAYVYTELRSIAQQLIKDGACISLKQLAVSGEDIAALGAKRADIGQTLKSLLFAVADQQLQNEKAALLAHAKVLLETPGEK